MFSHIHPRKLLLAALLLLLGALAVFFLRGAPPEEQPSPLIIMPPEWLPPREAPTGEFPPSPLGAQQALRVVSFRNEDARVYGLGTVAILERGSSVSFEVYLPPVANGGSYAAWVIQENGSLLSVGALASRPDGWFSATANLPGGDLGDAQGLRITRRAAGESGPGESVVSGTLVDVLH